MVRVSPIYSFVHEAEAPFDLFLRYYACDPQDGPEYEFYSDEEDAPTQAPEYVSLSTESEKENITPKEYDDTLSVEESWYPVLTREFPQGPTDEETLRSVCPFATEIAKRIASKGLS